jgi:NADP-dependent 3-hydroxy acid dehydrogenase YdfG
MDNIAGKVVAITGASSGLGAETARHLADSFARCVLFAMSQPENVGINEILFRPTWQEL